MFFKILLLIFIILHQFVYCMWRTERQPIIKDYNITRKLFNPHRKNVQEKILLYHNYYRSTVNPSASNMLKLSWNRIAAKAAHKWSKQCMFLTHDNITGRHIEEYGACGQNIFVSSHKVPWLFAIKTWYLERNNFTYGSDNNTLKVVGHYTQMIWAATHEIGCGVSKCSRNGKIKGKTYFNYVCNYCPIGNRPGQTGTPYKKGTKCTSCNKSCHMGRLCKNGCHASDQWDNCQSLFKRWPGWLCGSTGEQGRERRRNCRATCRCKNKIHD